MWANEARDFTLRLRDNIDLLCEALGVELEITESEGEVGDFYVDLVGHKVEFGRVAVIETIEVNDHDHLQVDARGGSRCEWSSGWPRVQEEHALDLNSAAEEVVLRGV